MNEKLLERIDNTIKVSKEMGSEIPAILKEVKDQLENKGRSDYERGMNDIWEALKVFALTGCTNRKVYYDTIPSDVSGSLTTTLTTTLFNLTPQEFMAKHEGAMKKMEEEKAEALKPRRGDKVRCVGRCEVNFDAIYLGEDDRFYHVLTRDDPQPQSLSKTYGWTLTKYEGQHVDLDGLLGWVGA